MHNDPIEDMIFKAKTKIMMNSPFMAPLVASLVSVDASKWLSTMATDGYRLYYNREFVKKRPIDELIFIVAHEVMHCAYDHIGRGNGAYDRNIMNMAMDYRINFDIVEWNETLPAGKKLGVCPSDALYDKKYDEDWISEAIYHDLMKNAVQFKMGFDEHLDLECDEGDEEGKGKSKDGDGDGDGDVTVTVLGKDGPPKLTAEQIEKMRQDVRNRVISAAVAAGAGNIPAGIARALGSLLDPKLDWRSLLECFVKSLLKSDYTFKRPSRRSWVMPGGIILPGQNHEMTVKVHCSIDTSGSMTDDMLREFLSEVKGIMTQFKDFELYLWTFDTQVYGYKKFTMHNANEIEDYKAQGGGGTDFMVNYDFMKENHILPDRFVMFTDGYPNGSWGDPNFCQSLFIVYGKGAPKSPFGTTVPYERKERK